MSGRKISVLIADDHSIVRMGLATLLEIENDMILVGQAANGQTAVEEALRLKPDVVVMDLMMPVLNGADATALISAKLPETKVVLFTTFPTSDLITVEDIMRLFRLRLDERDELGNIAIEYKIGIAETFKENKTARRLLSEAIKNKKNYKSDLSAE